MSFSSTAENEHMRTVRSTIDQLLESDSLSTLKGTSLDLDSEANVDNLFNGSNRDTPMETFLRKQFSGNKRTLEWSSKIEDHYLFGTNTNNFVPLETYIQNSVDLTSLDLTQYDPAEVCYVLIKYIRHGAFSLTDRYERDVVSKIGTYHIFTICAAVVPWKGVTDRDTIRRSLVDMFNQHTPAETISGDDLGDEMQNIDNVLVLRSNGMARAQQDSRRMQTKLSEARLEMYGLAALLLTTNISFVFLYFRRHDWCKKYQLAIMAVALAGMAALSVRAVMYTTSAKETFVNPGRDTFVNPGRETFVNPGRETFVNAKAEVSLEMFDTAVPAAFEQSASHMVAKESLVKEQNYNRDIVTDVVEDKTAEADEVDRQRLVAEHMYSSFRFRERQTFRTNGILQLALTMTLLVAIIVLSSSARPALIIAMYAVVYVLALFLYAAMYRIDSRRVRTNWEKVYHTR